jgi:hypothetical protein
VTTSIHESFWTDQRRLEALLERILVSYTANDQKETSTLWTKFDSGLRTHLEAEERHLISELLRASERNARVLLREHRHIRTRLTELGTGFRLHTAQLDSVRNFVDELRAHANNEDRLLYQWADARFDEPARASAIEALAGKPTSDDIR